MPRVKANKEKPLEEEEGAPLEVVEPGEEPEETEEDPAIVGESEVDADVPEGTPHTLTEEDLKDNPALEAEGLKVGDVVYLPEAEEEITEEVPPTPPEEVKEEPPVEPAPPVEEVLPTTPVEPEVVAPEFQPEPEIAEAELGKPAWCDAGVWGGLNLEQKKRLCNGESLSTILK